MTQSCSVLIYEYKKTAFFLQCLGYPATCCMNTFAQVGVGLSGKALGKGASGSSDAEFKAVDIEKAVGLFALLNLSCEQPSARECCGREQGQLGWHR